VGRKVPLRAAEFGPQRLDAALADVARRQHGVVSREQLRVLGLGDAAITQRLAAGRLHRVHQGVFAHTLRFTDRHLTKQPHDVARAIAAALADRRAA
jgi:hypothetical protein